MPQDSLFKKYLSGKITFQEYLRGNRCVHNWVEVRRESTAMLGTYINEQCSLCGKSRLQHE